MQIWPAPAKLNLFLHIIGQREDGYHLLQSVIQLVDLCDELTFVLRADADITCENSNSEISSQDDLCVKAAKLLQEKTQTKKGVDIRVKKNIPLGAGMGGGSSDAATTLLALNQIWGCGLQHGELEQLAIQLGADVPVFIRGEACWVEGIGEQLSSITLDELWYVVVFPNVHLNTQQMFADSNLTRNCAPIRIRDFLLTHNGSMNNSKSGDHPGALRNVFEPIARCHPEIEHAFNLLSQHASARLTGSGSGIFTACESKRQAEQIAESCGLEFTTYVTKGLNRSPVI